MSPIKVSVVIPVYNGSRYIGEAIQSVLNQTYQNFEIIVVDDASIDQTSQVIGQFDDARIKYIRHENNRGSNYARQTGISASSGEIIAWLDQDDIFHEEKLQSHVDFLINRPEVGFTYNDRFELNHASTTIRDIYRAGNVTLANTVMGYPISPSQMVLTRAWGTRFDLWHDDWIISGGEVIIISHFIFAGCGFGYINRALNYRRYHSRRILSNLSNRCESELKCQETVFSDHRCPEDVLALRDLAYSNTYKSFACLAFAQDETSLGQDYLREGIRLNPKMLAGEPCELTDFLVHSSIVAENHDVWLQKIFAQLPIEIGWLNAQYEWAVGHGYLLRGAKAVIWGKVEEGREQFECAAEHGAQVDELFLSKLTYDLMNYEAEFGTEATNEVIGKLIPCFKKFDNGSGVRRLKGNLFVNQAFQHYRTSEYSKVPGKVIQAIANDHKHLLNRGVLSVMIQSLIREKL